MEKKKTEIHFITKKKSNCWNIKRNLSVWSGLSRRKELKLEGDEQRRAECGGREGDGQEEGEGGGGDKLPEDEEEATKGVDEGRYPRPLPCQLDQNSRLISSSFKLFSFNPSSF